MFRLFIVFVVSCISSISFAQSKLPKEISFWSSLSAHALEVRDWQTYKMVNWLLNEVDTMNDTLYKKNILYAMSELQEAESCFILAKNMVEKHKTNIDFLDFYAKSADRLGRYGDSYIAYEKLYAFTLNTKYGYMAANSQYYLGRYFECMGSIEELRKNRDITAESIEFALSSNTKQSVSVDAALYNLQGMVYYEMQKKEKSRDCFRTAVQIMPSFQVAEENLKSLEQELGNQ